MLLNTQSILHFPSCLKKCFLSIDLFRIGSSQGPHMAFGSYVSWMSITLLKSSPSAPALSSIDLLWKPSYILLENATIWIGLAIYFLIVSSFFSFFKITCSCVFIFIYSFLKNIYLAVSGLSCGVRDL